ncbi:MAG: ubiquitin-like protein UBact [Nitrospinaceae bacterium]|nr:ubiquitin-like protein UBact [Nitrospinaceae bacterium]NIR53887.1 ubiquitin-like protein UBact [Nitrospinaceae bacterium]NIS84301.1 ubiquitin-like protein UBact [Nitrospinaceae bacterium]NIT81108.1 ubiquitin-like protein UBact [Nitrospinaceae bacterium]NIU43390.1 ubiquitin-like protein UBact [Nitrospinaceae bacterium]
MDMNDPLRREERKESTPDREDRGPSRPDASRPGRDSLLKRMKRVDPKQSERYRQRTGQ